MKWTLTFIAAATCATAVALGARDLVPDAERLYEQTATRDSEHRAVALRLADLMFDAAVEIDGYAKATNKDMAKAENYRRRAQSLYEESLPHMSGAAARRVKFQLSRLFIFAGRPEPAMKYWAELSRQNEDPLLKRESALHLAEQLELSNNAESIQEAGRLYAVALPLAEKQSLKSYIHYRLAWTQFRAGQTDKAVSTLQKSLELAESDREREDLLKDMVLFLSRQSRPAAPQMALLADYEKRYHKSGLVEQLAEAYYTADRKDDYLTIGSRLNERHPTLERTISLLDVAHDTLSRKEIDRYLAKLQTLRTEGEKFAGAETEKHALDRFYRLVLLWDGQRRAHPADYDDLFAKGVDAMLVVFPKSEEAKKSVGGWLAAHDDKQKQLAQFDHWLELTAFLQDPKLEASFRQNKLELARQLKEWTVVVEESKRLETLAASQTREARYQRAKALYELKKYDEALPLFLALAESSAKADDITKYSQDLALDIYAQEKRYEDIIHAAKAWRGTGARAQEMVALEEKAVFERAVLAQDSFSLGTFTHFCLARKFLPKSCENAKSLAARLRDQEKLVVVLRAQGDEKELAQQLEVGGRFAESARLLEKTAKDDLSILKVALLFELQGELKERDRVLHGFVMTLSKRKTAPSADEQNLIFLTLQDAGLVNEEFLSLPFASEYKVRAADQWFVQSGSKAARKILIDHCEGPAGPGWQKAHLQPMLEVYDQQRQIRFVGKQSKAHFERRVKALKNLSTQADCFDKGASPELRLAMARKMAFAYTELSAQIRATEIPEGLDAETLTQVKAQINDMAAPFETTSEQWTKLADKSDADAAKVPDGWNFAPIEENARPPSSKLAFDWKPMVDEIRRHPFAREPQENLKSHFDQMGTTRLSAYMNGRLQALAPQAQPVGDTQ